MQRIPLATRLFLLCALLSAGCAVSHPMTRVDVISPVTMASVPEPAPASDIPSIAPPLSIPPTVEREPRTVLRRHRGQVGDASFYDASFNGRTTASGDTYDERKLTAAHPTLALGTRVRVTNLENEKSVVVVVNDRGPYVTGRIIDLSRRAARLLGFVDDGTTRVRVQPL
ncbi:MAG: septal ring lytic transglycosylase RlpA family protein [Bacteroidota bacterium]